MKKLVKDNPSLVKDTKSKLVLNVNNEALQTYKTKRNAILNNKKDIEDLRNEVSEIKNMLGEILNRVKS